MVDHGQIWVKYGLNMVYYCSTNINNDGSYMRKYVHPPSEFAVKNHGARGCLFGLNGGWDEFLKVNGILLTKH
jgi:hypothetical protein